MGGGSWTDEKFRSYSKSVGRSVDSSGYSMIKGMSAEQVYTQKSIADSLNPVGIKVRECRDSEEHPNTVPVILALDVTGSMGETAVDVASKLNVIITELYKSITDVEFMIMGIGDFIFDRNPLQVSQFESDIRIAEQLDQLYFEFGGGPNDWESYSAAWAFANKHTDLDCWKRGKRGIIITMGDEELNPSLPAKPNYELDAFAQEVDTKKLYDEVSKKYDIYHIDVDHRGFHPDMDRWHDVLGKDHVFKAKVDSVAQIITEIIKTSINRVSFDMFDIGIDLNHSDEEVNVVSW